MADIDRIVKVTITRQTQVPSVASFSNMLIASEFLMADVTPVMTADERVREYGSLAEVADAFGTTHNVYKMVAKMWMQNPSPAKVYVGRKLTGVDGTETWTEALTAINTDNNAWYALVADTRTLADQQLIATWVESNTKLCGLASDDINIISGTDDIAEYINTNNFDRTFVFYSAGADGTATDNFIEAAVFGKMLPKDPGAVNWALKTLAGVAADNLTGGQITTVEGKKGNYYTEVAGISVTQFGTVGSGEFIDVIHGIDWEKANIQQKVFTPLVQQDKISFTDAGIQSIVGQLKTALQDAVDVGLFSEYGVTYPEVANVSAADKANRLLPDVNFTAILAGAINKTEIVGVVSL